MGVEVPYYEEDGETIARAFSDKILDLVSEESINNKSPNSLLFGDFFIRKLYSIPSHSFQN